MPLSSKDRDFIVNYHNTVRSNVALGLQAGQPIATNMRQLVKYLFIYIQQFKASEVDTCNLYMFYLLLQPGVGR